MNTKKNKVYTRYLKNNEKFIPIGESVEMMPPGFYQPVYDSYKQNAFFVEKNVIMPNLYVLSNDVQKNIIDDIHNFWASEDRYRKFGSVYKRNILMYSTPGNGKTSLINIVCKQLIEEQGGVVILIDSTSDLSAYNKCMDRLRDIEPNRKVITVIEDFERLTKDDHFASMLLQLLDGNKQYDNVVTIATTNYPSILEKRFVCRPSRFNIIIEFPKPNETIRREYFQKKLSDGGIDINDEGVKKDIERYVEKSDGYTFDFIKELIQGIYVDGLGEDVVFKRLEDIKDKNGKYIIEDDSPRRIGFGSLKRLGRHVPEEDECDEYDTPSAGYPDLPDGIDYDDDYGSDDY